MELTMSAATYNIDAKRGLPYKRTLTVKEGDGTVRLLTAYTSRLRIRSPRAGSEDIDVTPTMLPEDGKIIIDLAYSFVDTLPPIAEYRLDLINPDDEPEPLLSGPITKSEDL